MTRAGHHCVWGPLAGSLGSFFDTVFGVYHCLWGPLAGSLGSFFDTFFGVYHCLWGPLAGSGVEHVTRSALSM